ncbi:MAG: S-layer homology domain-containing protein [Paenibacillaceae bacterium]
MKKMTSALFLVIMLFFSFSGLSMAAEQVETKVTADNRVQVTMEFADAAEAKWATEYIANMKSKQILSGYKDGTFRPNQPIKRVEAIVTAVRLMGLEEEAKAVSADTKLNFKDANLIDKNYSWAKGYIVVALKNGLFDTSEDRMEPDKPASRVWVATLLVRALGLQSEALSQMNTVLDFKDADSIPAGAVGYVSIVVERSIVSGYPDNTFKPNKNVTRAEIAVLLDKTNDSLLEETGAITVTGKITHIDFGTSDAVDTTGEVTEATGTITIESLNGEEMSYSISSGLLVQSHEQFIPADQLLADDVVSLVVKDEFVTEAALLDQEALENNVSGMQQFELKVKLGEDEYKYKYKNKKDKIEAEIKTKLANEEEKIKGDEAVAAVEAFLQGLALTPDMSEQEIVEKVLNSLNIESSAVTELELKIKFSNGKVVKIENDDEDENKDDNKDGNKED